MEYSEILLPADEYLIFKKFNLLTLVVYTRGYTYMYLKKKSIDTIRVIVQD